MERIRVPRSEPPRQEGAGVGLLSSAAYVPGLFSAFEADCPRSAPRESDLVRFELGRLALETSELVARDEFRSADSLVLGWHEEGTSAVHLDRDARAAEGERPCLQLLSLTLTPALLAVIALGANLCGGGHRRLLSRIGSERNMSKLTCGTPGGRMWLYMIGGISFALALGGAYLWLRLEEPCCRRS